MRLSLAAFASACCLALAACASSAPPDPASPQKTASDIPPITAPTLAQPTPIVDPVPSIGTQAPSPSPGAKPPGDPCKDPGATASGLAPIAFNRYADICLGMSFAEATEAMPGPTIAGLAECPWYANVLAIDDPGLYVSAITRPDAPGESIFMFRMTWQGSLANAAAFPAPETSTGISVGSSTAEVKQAYPGASSVVVDDPSVGQRTQLVAKGPNDTYLVFDVTEGRVSSMYWGTGLSSGSVAELCAL